MILTRDKLDLTHLCQDHLLSLSHKTRSIKCLIDKLHLLEPDYFLANTEIVVNVSFAKLEGTDLTLTVD